MQVVLEVGMGGGGDATNVVTTTKVVVVTSIGACVCVCFFLPRF